MKILNILKKNSKKITKSNSQTLDKKQLEKVLGGGDSAVLDQTTAGVRLKKIIDGDTK